ncbi:Cytochrome b2, mitochondrial [Fulvia fulva]|uniref:Cytochrome b2, mitochondrial n=1 Tax=Passalora fulva TaxID=5499 RepID=A0A9Q8PKS9_PASFU|nr:Cytochrome b2, mitochondrial [Fulvia fulva]KAK4610344.1 Cytochrome b2, mitochondrial [Fulvia fulva]KAK4611284.1 Cytochrome b2, mitochondrial [Fulvia fulva]UJO24464.1 Cytochrome b2, mitochondrial [Fulvia fulva]WPV21871.1 Cytochrome b2, mitochondrial [Fulvia fulva]WPV37348.1 Cytochrome b2, mitochondrial [Fulvia fulva]
MLLNTALSLSLVGAAYTARPYMFWPDTGVKEQFGTIETGGQLLNVSDVVRYINSTAYTYYYSGAAGEWSYRDNLEVFQRIRLRLRVMVQVDNIEASLPTTILGHNFSAPFFISPCARAGYANDDAEKNLVKGAAASNILYIVTDFSSVSKEEVQSARADGQILFQQLYIDLHNKTRLNFNAIVLTVDSAVDGNHHRAMRNQTKLPIVPKGIQSVEDAIEAVNHGAPAILLSNHGGRQLDGSPSGLEVFEQTEVWANSDVRYGADVVKLLAPFMFSNVFGAAGVERAVEIMKREVAIDAANAGIRNLKDANVSYIDFTAAKRWGTSW